MFDRVRVEAPYAAIPVLLALSVLLKVYQNDRSSANPASHPVRYATKNRDTL